MKAILINPIRMGFSALALAVTGCGLTPIRTEVEVEGPAADLRYVLTGEGEPTGSAPIRAKYSTSADKSVGLQIDNTYGEGGVPASMFLEFTSASDSEVAGAARIRDNDRLQAQSQAIINAIGSALQLAAQVSAPPVPVSAAPPPPQLTEEQIAVLLKLANSVGNRAPVTPAPAAPDGLFIDHPGD